MVPNPPLFFADAPDKGRSEDDIIACSRVKHFTTKDDPWLVRLAMVKSGVRAMDAIQQFLRRKRAAKQRSTSSSWQEGRNADGQYRHL
jgi:PhoPQ-activated pathogenicity-related protein